MARANNNGWDFIKVGETYQYKEDSWIAMVTIIEDNSTEKAYCFKLRVEKASEEPPQNGEFEIYYVKDINGFYSGMLQFYKNPEYSCNYKWVRDTKEINT